MVYLGNLSIPNGDISMTDEELKQLISLGVKINARISQEKFRGDIKNIIQIDLAPEKKTKEYKKVAKELARRLSERGLAEEKIIPYEKLSEIEKQAVIMIRNDSNRDIEHLKGDYVISNFLEIERIKRNKSVPPLKRLQLNDKQIYRIFQLNAQKVSIREIASSMGLNRGTVNKVLKKDYIDKRDIERIRVAEKKVAENHKTKK